MCSNNNCEDLKDVLCTIVKLEEHWRTTTLEKDKLVKEFEEVVFNLKNGEISDIVETPFGLHIITKVSEEKLQPIPEDVAKAEIKNIIEKTKFEKWFEDTKKKLNVSVDYSKLDNIFDDFCLISVERMMNKYNKKNILLND